MSTSDSGGITSLSVGADEFDEQFPECVQPLGGLWPVRERGRREDEKYCAGEQVGQCMDHGSALLSPLTPVSRRG